MTLTQATFATPRLLERERAHRRGVAVSMAVLLLFSTSPVFGHHFAEPVTEWLVGRDHLLNLCVVAMHEVMAPLHRAFHAMLALGIGYGIVDRFRAMFRLRATMRVLCQEPPLPGGPIARAAATVGVDVRHIRVLRDASAPAFTTGLFRPVIFIAAALVKRLSADELQAVIAHENAHRRRRDPLRLSAWRFLACALFFLPALRRLVDDMADEAEVAADDEAAAHPNVEALALASALISIAERFRPRPELTAAVVGFVGRDLLDRRVRRLAGEDVPIVTHVTRRSLAGAGLALSAAWISGLLVVHPLPQSLASAELGVVGHHTTRDTPHHCEHEGDWAFTHLFCLGSSHRSANGDCPHQASKHATER